MYLDLNTLCITSSYLPNKEAKTGFMTKFKASVKQWLYVNYQVERA